MPKRQHKKDIFPLFWYFLPLIREQYARSPPDGRDGVQFLVFKNHTRQNKRCGIIRNSTLVFYSWCKKTGVSLCIWSQVLWRNDHSRPIKNAQKCSVLKSYWILTSWTISDWLFKRLRIGNDLSFYIIVLTNTNQIFFCNRIPKGDYDER